MATDEENRNGPAAKRQRVGAYADNGSAAAEGKPAGGNQRDQTGGNKKDKRKERDMRIPAMHQAIKHNNLQFAMQQFREVRAEGAQLAISLINSLMYLGCGGLQWERYARGLPLLSAEEAAAAAATEGGAEAEAGAGQGKDGEKAAEAGTGGEAEQQQQQQQQQQQRQQQQKQKGKRPVPLVPALEGPPPSREDLLAVLDELVSYMDGAGLKPDQGTYLALARREALRGDPRAALQWARECHSKGKPVQLRLFHPAQVGFCLAGDLPSLLEVDQLIASHKLDPTEYEYARLLEGLVTGAGSYEQMKGVLLRIQSDLNTLSPATADYIAAFFDSSAAQQAFAGQGQGGCPVVAAALSSAPSAEAVAGSGAQPPAPRAVGSGEQQGVVAGAVAAEAASGQAADAAGSAASGAADEAAAAAVASPTSGSWRWRLQRGVGVEPCGRCEAAGGSLRVIDLEDQEWDAFAAAIADLARSNMGHRAKDFDSYVGWYDKNGPYDILVDAANVAFFGQNHEGGGFQWTHIMDMWELLKQRFPDKKVLVMLHRKRLNDPEAHRPGVQAFVEQLQKRRAFYHTPPGANDDWFWLYACVRAKHAGLLVSNDELRDHIFSLLRPRHFLKWKERHIAHYGFSGAATQAFQAGSAPPKGQRFDLQLPHPYTACVQQLPESGAWVVPLRDGTWWCVRPERV